MDGHRLHRGQPSWQHPLQGSSEHHWVPGSDSLFSLLGMLSSQSLHTMIWASSEMKKKLEFWLQKETLPQYTKGRAIEEFTHYHSLVSTSTVLPIH
ncbi:mCG148145 [Mus musculus]|nr:mCG148145 [Mus musculus]